MSLRSSKTLAGRQSARMPGRAEEGPPAGERGKAVQADGESWMLPGGEDLTEHAAQGGILVPLLMRLLPGWKEEPEEEK